MLLLRGEEYYLNNKNEVNSSEAVTSFRALNKRPLLADAYRKGAISKTIKSTPISNFFKIFGAMHLSPGVRALLIAFSIASCSSFVGSWPPSSSVSRSKGTAGSVVEKDVYDETRQQQEGGVAVHCGAKASAFLLDLEVTVAVLTKASVWWYSAKNWPERARANRVHDSFMFFSFFMCINDSSCC